MLLHAVSHVLELTLAILMDFCREDWGDLVDLSLPKRGMGRESLKAVEILSSVESGRLRSIHCTAKLWIGAFGAVLPWRTDQVQRRSRNGRRRQNSLPPNT